MTWAPFSIVGEEINRMGSNPDGLSGGAEYSRISRDLSDGVDEEQYPMMEMNRASLGSVERPAVPAVLHEGGNELSGV